VPNGTSVTALVATFTTTGSSVKVGTVVQTSAATANNFTSPVLYTVTATDTTTAIYTVTVTVASSSAKTITAYSFAGFSGASGVINESAKTIAVTVPNGTSVTALVATFTTTGSSVKVGTVVQTSAATANNFTSPVPYTVTATDTTTAIYTVTVTVASSSAKTITAYSFIGFSAYPGTVDEAAKTVTVTLPYGTDVTALTAKYTTTGTVVKIGSVVQTSEASPTNDFTTPKAYTVTAADLSTTLVPYTVTVTIAVANPTAPTFGETARFVILASQRITTTAGSAISNGDIGIEDQARSYYGGFTAGANPGQLTVLTNGLSYAHDDIDPALIPSPYASTIAFINQVRTDLGIAYTFLAADPNPTAPTQVCPIQLGGLTLTRGVYKTASNVGITTGPLHLDAQGDPNAVFIFTTAGSLTIGAPSGGIILDNGALARNVYFRAAGITTIEAGIIAYGNIFSYAQVNMLAGASITGRLFSVNEQVTLISNAVTKAP
jgi:acetylglutamate kinase